MLNSGFSELERIANDRNIPVYVAAIEAGTQAYKIKENWPEPNDLDLTSGDQKDLDLIASAGEGILSDLAQDMAKVVKFPVNTAFLHSVGVVASAMTKAFKYNYNGFEKPVNLYICTAQPPSSGKSGINEMLIEPVLSAYDLVNKKNKRKLTKLLAEKAELEKSLRKDKIHDDAFDSKSEMLDKVEDDIKNCPIWRPAIKDATIEAAEEVAKHQSGMINIISDEAEAINTIFGNTYVKDGAKANYGLLLSAWDGDRFDSVRISREAFSGRARSTISVIAQSDSIESILRAGATGRGLAERFLLLSEPSLLGQRDHAVSIAPNFELHQRYAELVSNIINEESVTLEFSKSAKEIINDFRNSAEKEMNDCGAYEHNLLTGFMGKFDKQVYKIACVLHACEHWQTGGTRTRKVSSETILNAIYLFSDLSSTYIKAADKLGYVGENSEVIVLSEVLTAKLEKGVYSITLKKLVDNIKNRKPFAGSRNLTRKIREKIIPELEKNGHCYMHNKKIFINPRLK